MSDPPGLRLTLLRHGRAETQAPGQADFDRALDRRGIAEVAGMARRWLELGRRPDELRASAALRTRQTADTFARELGLPPDALRFERALYLADPATLIGSIRATDARVRHLMLVGHNPGLADLVRHLAPGAEVAGFETAATCSMRILAPEWGGLGQGAVADLQYDSPSRPDDARA